MEVTAGSTNVSVDIRAMTSAGAVVTGKVAADFTLWYRRDGAKVSISLSDLSALTDAHSDGGVLEIGDGWYRLDAPDAAFASSANRVAIGGTVAGGVVLSAPISIVSGGTAGSGAIEWTVKITDASSNPIDGVEVWVTSDAAGSNVVAGTLTTDANGEVDFMLDAGTYYVWKQKAGYNFTNPETTVVS